MPNSRHGGAPIKLKLESSAFSATVAQAARAVESRGGALQVLGGVHLSLTGSTLTATGSDLDLSIAAKCAVNGQENGVIVVPAKLLNDVARVLPSGAVSVETTVADEVTICGGRACYTLRTIPHDEWPRMPHVGGEGVTVDAAMLADTIMRVGVAASQDQSRSVILTAVLLEGRAEGLRLVATDSYRLHVADLPGTTLGVDGKVLVPSSMLKEVSRLIPSGDVTVAFSDTLVEFRTDTLTVVSRLVAGEFPAYANLIPKSQPHLLTVARDEFADTIKRMAVMARDSTPLRITCGPEVSLSATAMDTGHASSAIDGKYEGEDLVLAFNPDYLAAAVNACDGETIEVGITDPLKPAIVRSPSDPNFFALAMPVRVG